MAYLSYKGEYINIDDKLASKLEILNDIMKINDEDIDKIIEQMSKECTYMTDNLEENVLKFKLFSKEVAKGYKEAVEAESNALCEIWESCEEKRKQAYNKTKEINNLLSETTTNIKTIKKELSELNVYGADKLIEVLNRFQNMSTSDKELFRKLLEIDK